jgi:hypothetical protein
VPPAAAPLEQEKSADYVQNGLESTLLHHPSVIDAVSTISSKLVNAFLQEKLPGLLTDILTHSVVPQIVNALQSSGTGAFPIIPNIAPSPNIPQAAERVGRTATEGFHGMYLDLHARHVLIVLLRGASDTQAAPSSF